MLFTFQTELTCQRIQEFETQASSDLELRNNKIDELNRVSKINFEMCYECKISSRNRIGKASSSLSLSKKKNA